MNLIYLGSSRPEVLNKELLDMGSHVDVAGNTLQNSLLQGLFACIPDIKVISAWSVSKYPKVKKIKFNRRDIAYMGIKKYVYVGGWNLPVINLFSRFLRTRKELKRTLSNAEDNYVLVYETHTPFMLAAATLRKKIKHINLIVPDLPEFMSSNQGKLYLFLKSIDKCIINWCIKRFDSFTLLSASMTERLAIGDKSWTVMEGIYQPPMEVLDFPKDTNKVIFYGGHLDKRYGILDLLEAFIQIKGEDYRLLICGKGDSIPTIQEYAKKDNRIQFLGLISRSEVIGWQKKATVLVNPRHANEEYTQYSFPSKTIEYLASGTPVVMHRLGCMTKEYDSFVFYAEDDSVEALREKLYEVCEKSREELAYFGNKAHEFILSNKTSKAQCMKILDLIVKDYH